MDSISMSAASAIITILIASRALEIAAAAPWIYEVIRVVIAKPEAPSAAELIFLPIDSFSIAESN